MGSIQKIQIFNPSQSGQNAVFATQVNPSSIKIGKKISYEKIQALGQEQNLARYKYHEPSSLSFEIYMDDTGTIPNGSGMAIPQRVEQLESALYKTKQELEEPGYAILVWGSLIFHGRVESIDYEYSMFASDGSPLRVKISLSFVGYFEEYADGNKKTSQASRVVTFQSGDRLADYCEQIYGDASLCLEVAAQNALNSLRNVSPGTMLYFSSLTRK